MLRAVTLWFGLALNLLLLLRARRLDWAEVSIVERASDALPDANVFLLAALPVIWALHRVVPATLGPLAILHGLSALLAVALPAERPPTGH